MRRCLEAHANCAFSLDAGGKDSDVAFAHRLAAAMIAVQSTSGRGPQILASLAASLAADPLLRVPSSFDELSDIVERVEGVHFRELFARIPAREGSGDEVLAKIMTWVHEEVAGADSLDVPQSPDENPPQ